ncbi:BTB/POZ domain-containing protein 8 isoform X2 [Ambystoma mexicanum]|uniref:BTB/POZ domain-containing protein 8 isoform X2 n=1 Tax=Ambystoma mexicanum TaxID=8296 RepID=UPI0037E77F9E
MASCAGALAQRGASTGGLLKGFTEKEASERQRLKELLAEQLSGDLLRLLKEETLADVVFLVGHATFRAHRAILQARVPNFYLFIIGKDLNTSTQLESFNVLNCEPSDFRTFLHIVYSSERDIKEVEEELLNAIQKASETTVKHISLSNVKNKETSNVQYAQNVVSILHDDFELEPASKLGEDLLSIYKNCYFPDLEFCIGEHHFQAHRAILCARSNYFAAMLNGGWAESTQNQISLKGVSPVEVNVMMHFIYGATLDFSNKVDAGQILCMADMYGLEGLKEVAIYILKRDLCKFFHKPVAGMQQSVPECLTVAYQLGIESLHTSCMRWIVKHFGKSWSERSFANLPVDLQRDCLLALIQSLNHKNAALLLMESDKLITSLPGVKWAEKALTMTLHLKEECVNYIVANFSQIIKSESFYNLLQAQGMSSTPYLLEQVISAIDKSVSFENSCILFIALEDLMILVTANEMAFTCSIQALRDKLWIFLVQSFYAVRHTQGWKLMRPDDQQKIQAAAVDKGDDRRLGKKPTFSSSQQNRCTKSYNLKQSSKKVESKGSSWNCSSLENMKSDGLGASGHTASANRSAPIKVSKHDDIKGNDGKKALSRTTKDHKSLEKNMTSKPKTVLKPKTENANGKTEASHTKQDSEMPLAASGPRNGACVKGLKHPDGKPVGARPKTVSSSSHLQVKATTGKKPALPLSTARTSKKSELSNQEPLLSSAFLEQHTEGVSGNEQKVSTAKRQSYSPISRNVTKVNTDCSEDVAGKSKPSAKISNGLVTKKKVIETGHNGETCSLTKILDGKGHIEQNSKTKKKSNMNGSAQQRAKSAPPALVKKQGLHNDTTSSVKSASSHKQNEERTPTKHFDNVYSDRQMPSKKNKLKPSIKANGKPVMLPTAHQPSKKMDIAGKELKQKYLTMQPASKPQSPAQRESFQKNKSGIVPKAGGNQSSIEKVKTHESTDLPLLGNCKIGPIESLTGEESDCALLVKDEAYLSTLHSLSSNIGNNIEVVQHCDNESDSSEERTHELVKQKVQENGDYCNGPSSSFSSGVSSTSAFVPNGNNLCKSHFEGFINGNLSDGSAVADHEFDSEELEEDSNCHAGQVFSKVVAVSPKDIDTTETPESHDQSETPLVDHWTLDTSILHQKESPESDSASATTSSDDIKPRSEDYDAGGSQDDDGSNERGISKCSTMLCHDFLGRSSSDTSTPEELKVYDSSLRIEVKMKKEICSDCFRVNSTSDDEGPRKKCDIWPHRENILISDRQNEDTTCGTARFAQEVDQVSSSADETEDEKSEADHVVEHCPADAIVQPFQGIVNLAFDDTTENDVESQAFPSATKFKRSVLLSVDECEELGSDEGETQTPNPRSIDSRTSPDVFDGVLPEHHRAAHCRNSLKTETLSVESTHQVKEKSDNLEKCTQNNLNLESAVFVGQDRLSAPSMAEENKAKQILSTNETPCCKDEQKMSSKMEGLIEVRQYNRRSDTDLKSQDRPCHLDLNKREPSSHRHQHNSAKVKENSNSPLPALEDQVTENSTTENSNTDLTSGAEPKASGS